MTEFNFNDRRYTIIDRIGAGGFGTVYHAHDRLLDRNVALKIVSVDQVMDVDSQATESTVLLALANEFRTLASLRHRHIIEVLDYGFDTDRRPYFTMDYLKNAETLLDAAKSKGIDMRIRLVGEMLESLDYLHRHNVIHRDLKPDNVLVNEEDQVKLLDFGLAKSLHMTEAEDEGDSITGTLAYIAPEVLQGQDATFSADLYAVGVMLYELFAGRHPFNDSNISAFITSIVAEIPDMSAITDTELLELNEDNWDNIADVISRLLRKDPEFRYRSAKNTIEALYRSVSVAIPEQDEAIRESYLQRASFVGREAELNQIKDLFDIIEKGTTKSLLIGGESGVGKSRLVDETRIQAAVRGISVFRGQSVSEGRSPYQVWRAVLRKLVIYVDISDEEASILKPLIADLSNILGKEVADAPQLEPPAAQERLNVTVEAVLRRYKRPALIILQDLHWMGDESLILLQYLLTNVEDHSVLIIGGYRNDEHPNLPKLLPVAETMQLQRFDVKTVGELTQAMIGLPINNEPILNFLYEHTEGNIYFLIETVRMLADEAGTLQDILNVTLPQSIVTSGIEQVIQRRIEQISPLYLSYVEFAAIIGRNLDRKLMEHIFPDMDYDEWLTICANAVIFDVQDTNWRFSHDKLREYVMKSLADETKVSIHRNVGETIEEVYGSPPEMITTLAHHFHEAANPEKAIPYLVQASNQALATGLPRESLNYGLMAVRMSGVDMPHTAAEAGQSISEEIGKIQQLLAGRSLAELKNLPKSENEPVTQAIGIMLQIAPSANIAQVPEFYVLMALRNFYLTLEHGSTMFTGAVFAVYASVFHINMSDDIKGGVELAQMAIAIDEDWGSPMRAFILFVNQWLNLHWNTPLHTLPAVAAEGAKLGFETGNFVFGCFNMASVPMWHARMGTPLSEVVQHARHAHEVIQGNVSSAAFHSIHEMQLAKAFMGQTESHFSLSDDEFNEENDIATVLQSQNVNQMAYYLWSKAMLHYLYDDSITAYEFVLQTLPIKVTVQGQMLDWEFDFFYTMILLDVVESDHETIQENLKKFQHYARSNPTNFGHKVQMIEAEIARHEDRTDDMQSLLEEAIAGAAEAGLHLYAAMAAERKGKHAINYDEALAKQALTTAIHHYETWEAHAKVADIQSRYSFM